jgi:kynureninase
VIDVARFRERFPILDTTTYLITHSLGAMPLAAEERLRDYARLWRERGVRAWGEGWWDAPWRVGGQIGRIIGAPPSSTVMHPNVTTAEAVIISCFDFAGADVVVVEDGVDAIVDAIDERTLLVPVSHVVFKTGELRDVEPIVRRAHEAGAVVVLDAYQSVGVVPLDVTALGVDFTVGGSVKWLCGGPGAAWLYVRPDVAARLEPTFVGWQAHADPFSFAPELAYAEGASRFLTGTPAVPALYAATAGYDIVEEVGVGAIRERSVHLTSLLIDRLEAAGLDVGSPRDPARRGGTVTVAVPEFEAVATELGEREILCDFRPGVGLRLGPHFYNTDSEVEFAASQIADIVESGSYERHLGAGARLTAG